MCKMTKEIFLNRLFYMKVDINKSVFEQITSRLYQCSFIRRNHMSVKISLSKSCFKLIESFENKLINYYRMLVKNGNIERTVYFFVINNFDLFIENFINLHNFNK